MSHVTRSPAGVVVRRVAGVRAARKQQTREAMLAAALRLMEHQSLNGLSLREVTRAAGIVPAAFYRHFPDMAHLGVALVEESLDPLRLALRAVRVGMTDSDEIIHRSIELLAGQVREHPDLFRFIARERHGGVRAVRDAIRHQLNGFADELAGDLLGGEVGGLARLREWRPEDVRMYTQLVVSQMVLTAAALLDHPAGDTAADAALLRTATTQLRLIVMGAHHWLDEE